MAGTSVDASSGAQGAAVYVGLSERSKLWVLLIAAIIATLNLMAAWYFSYEMGQNLKLSKSDMEPFVEWISTGVGGTVSEEARYDLAARAMHVVAMVKLIANKQGLVLACFGGAYALAAIGFALFIIGADGAFKVSAEASDKARLVFSGTAPGLLCFLICGWLIVNGIEQKSSLQLPPLWHAAADRTGGSPLISNCDHQDAAGKCYSKAEWAALLKK